MIKTSSPIATYERSFGTLKAVTSPDVADPLAGQRLAMLYEAYRSGIPGFVDKDTMTPGQVLEYMSVKLAPPTASNRAPINERPVDIILSTNKGPDELIATASFGATMTPAGLRTSRNGTRIAHASTFAVSRQPLGSEALSLHELGEVALALGHATLTAAETDFDEISYRVEEATRADAMSQLTALGLADDLQTRAEIAHFPSPVVNAPAMVRTEYALDIRTAQDALEAAHPWLVGSASS